MANLSNINNKFLVTTGGNVLIGSTAAVGSSLLQVTGSVNITGGTTSGLNITTSGTQDTIKIDRAATNDNAITKYQTASADKWIVGLRNTGDDNFRFYNYGTSSDVLVIDTSGKVGIGATSPDYTLHLLKSSGDTEMYINGQNGQSSLRMGLDARNWQIKTAAAPYLWSLNYVGTDFQTPNIITATVGGNVGIGTDSPGRQLTLSQDVSGETQQLLLVNRNDTNGDTSGILFGVLDNATYAKAGIFFERTDLQARGSLHFATDNETDSGHATKADARMTITHDGNVGIGTTSIPNPYSGAYSNVLQVGTTSGNTRIALTSGTTKSCDLTFADSNTASDAGSTAGAISYKHATDSMLFSTANAERMRINSQGQMWLGGSYTGSDIANGNTSYMNNLNAGSFSILHRNSSDVYVHFNSYYTSSNTYISKYSGRGFMLGYNAAVDTGFFFSKAPQTTAGQNQTFSQVMTVGYGTSNNVGIGTTSPDSLLQLESSANPDVELKISNTATVIPGNNFGGSKVRLIADGTNGDGLGALRHALVSETDSYENWEIRSGNSLGTLCFDTLASERMRITSAGLLFVGDTTTNYGYSSHHIARDYSQGYALIVRNSNTSTQNNSVIQLNQAETTSTTQGYFLIGRQGDPNSGSNRVFIYSNGDIKNQNNSYGAISDERLKENIVDATPKLDDLMKVKVRNFNLKGEETKQIGVVAQELEEVFPGMIDESKDPDSDDETLYKSVKYSVFVPMLIKSIQELKAEIEILKNK